MHQSWAGSKVYPQCTVSIIAILWISIAAAPVTAPRDVTIERLNGTAMNVSWVPLNLVEARGFVQSYVVTYEPASGGSRHKRQQQQAQVNGSASYGIVGGLQPGVAYNVRVSGQTTVGPPGPSELKPYVQ